MANLKPQILESVARNMAAHTKPDDILTLDSSNPGQYGFRGNMTTILRNGQPIRHMPIEENAKAVVARVKELIRDTL